MTIKKWKKSLLCWQICNTICFTTNWHQELDPHNYFVRATYDSWGLLLSLRLAQWSTHTLGYINQTWYNSFANTTRHKFALGSYSRATVWERSCQQFRNGIKAKSTEGAKIVTPKECWLLAQVSRVIYFTLFRS